MKSIQLVNSTAIALVDDCDFDAIAAYTWRIFEPKPGRFYARAWTGKRRESLHRFVAALAGLCGRTIDHSNGDGLDNRRSNLRAASYSQNNQNVLRDSTSGVPGVHRTSDGWIVRFHQDGRQKYFGFRHDLKSAIALANEVAQHGGEWRCRPIAKLAELERRYA